MSWSVCLVGKPDAVVRALEAHSEQQSGQSRVEYDDAKPHLIGLVKQNFRKEASGYQEPLIKLNASGSGYAAGDQQLQRSLTVTIEPVYGTFVT
jgi:hypothetical protein